MARGFYGICNFEKNHLIDSNELKAKVMEKINYLLGQHIINTSSLDNTGMAVWEDATQRSHQLSMSKREGILAAFSGELFNSEQIKKKSCN